MTWKDVSTKEINEDKIKYCKNCVPMGCEKYTPKNKKRRKSGEKG